MLKVTALFFCFNEEGDSYSRPILGRQCIYLLELILLNIEFERLGFYCIGRCTLSCADTEVDRHSMVLDYYATTEDESVCSQKNRFK